MGMLGGGGGGGKLLVFVPYSAKIADINEADINAHTFDIQTALSETRTVVAAWLSYIRIGGAGELNVYPNSGSTAIGIQWTEQPSMTAIQAGTQEVKYAQTVANDDFDVYCFGYLVEV